MIAKERREKEIKDEISSMGDNIKPTVSKQPKGAVNIITDDNMQEKTVKIIKYYTSEPNSASGVDCNIVWKNISSRTIKYITFTVVPYNAINDTVTCGIRGYSETRVNAIYELEKI